MNTDKQTSNKPFIISLDELLVDDSDEEIECNNSHALNLSTSGDKDRNKPKKDKKANKVALKTNRDSFQVSFHGNLVFLNLRVLVI